MLLVPATFSVSSTACCHDESDIPGVNSIHTLTAGGEISKDGLPDSEHDLKLTRQNLELEHVLLLVNIFNMTHTVTGVSFPGQRYTQKANTVSYL